MATSGAGWLDGKEHSFWVEQGKGDEDPKPDCDSEMQCHSDCTTFCKMYVSCQFPFTKQFSMFYIKKFRNNECQIWGKIKMWINKDWYKSILKKINSEYSLEGLMLKL